MDVREVASTTAGDQDLLSDPLRMVEQGDATASFSGFDGAHQAGGTGAQDDYVVGVFHG
jgi:hypothetical protein